MQASFADRKNIVFGPVDVSRYELPVVCAVLPGDQTSEDVSISEWDDNTDFTVAFVCQKADSQTLTKRMCRYASAFKELIKKNPTFGDAVENVEFRKASFFYDAGAVEDQVMVAEIELTIITANEFKI